MKKIVLRLVAGVITLILGIVLNYCCMPAWNLRSAGMYGFLIAMAVIATLLFGIAEYLIGEDYDTEFVIPKITAVFVGIFFVVWLIGAITTLDLFQADNYYQMTEFEEGNFEADIPEVSEETNISIVDVKTAQNLGDRAIGSIKNSTWYEVDDEYNLIKYQGEYYRISELNYGDFWKYLSAKESGIPGYVLVSATTQKATYVELEEPIKYSPSAYFSYLLERHLRKLYPNYIFGKSFFEIDEEGKPYYITSVKTPSIGWFGGEKEESFIITNASTGESNEYKTENLPEWVDHAYDLDYLMTITDNHQKYIDGWWNSFTSKTGVNSTSYQFKSSDYDGYNTAITKNGDIVFYTGVTPANGAESNLGFILANPRTGEITYYDCAGAEEHSAQTAAESLVQDLGYSATFPTILNIDGEETYFMLLKDKAGLVQRYALCNIKDYTKVVQSESLNEAIELYKTKIGTLKAEEEEILEKEGRIENLYQAEVDGCTYYYFTLEGSTDLYMSSIKNSNRQVLLDIGTKVSIEYTTSSEEGIFRIKKIQF